MRQICCWRCKGTHRTLRVVRDMKGKKTDDYVCEGCLDIVGNREPDIGNSSRIRYEKPIVEQTD